MTDGDEVSNMRLLEVLGHLHLRLTIDVNRSMANAGGLSLARYRVLRFVEAKSPTHAGAIREFFAFAPRTVTEALDGLERDGFIARTRTIKDRRKVEIAITPVGREILSVSEAPLLDAADRVFQALTIEEKATLHRLLSDAVENCHAA